MGAATYGTRRLAGSAAHAGPLLIDTGMAEGSWCAGMGTGCWPLACGCQVGGSWQQRGAWDTRTINTYSAEQRTWARSLPQLDACLAQDGHRVRRDTCSIWNPAMDLPELADQTSAGDTRQALAELALEVTVCKRWYPHAGISLPEENSVPMSRPRALDRRQCRSVRPRLTCWWTE